MKDEERADVVRRQGKTRGAFGFALNFWPYLFFQEKRWEKTEQEKSYIHSYSNASPGSA
jgi:hypothetical protein